MPTLFDVVSVSSYTWSLSAGGCKCINTFKKTLLDFFGLPCRNMKMPDQILNDRRHLSSESEKNSCGNHVEHTVHDVEDLWCWCFTAVGYQLLYRVCLYCICAAGVSGREGPGANISRVDTAHCPSYKRTSRITPSLESRGGKNSSMIMIPFHARQLLRAVLSTGSHFYSSRSSDRSHIKTGRSRLC